MMEIYGQQKPVLRKRIEGVTISISTRFVETLTCKSRAIPKSRCRNILELRHFRELQCRISIGRSERGSTGGLEVKDRASVVPPYPCSLAWVTIYKPSSTSESAVLLRLENVLLESMDWVVSFEARALKEYIVNEV